MALIHPTCGLPPVFGCFRGGSACAGSRAEGHSFLRQRRGGLYHRSSAQRFGQSDDGGL